MELSTPVTRLLLQEACLKLFEFLWKLFKESPCPTNAVVIQIPWRLAGLSFPELYARFTSIFPRMCCRKKSREGRMPASLYAPFISKDVSICKAVSKAEENLQTSPRTRSCFVTACWITTRKQQDEYTQSEAISSKTVFLHVEPNKHRA